ncbi:MAG: TldD/PmbA family protein [Deltaproteobacteria bacterium]|nr:TldD/PmbA family protein [Deltaproteobacteria bacterium]
MKEHGERPVGERSVSKAASIQAGVGSDLEALAEHVLAYARRGGAEEAAVQVGRSRFIEVRRRQGEIERLRASTSRGLSLALFVDSRFSTNATSVLDRRAVERFVDEVLAMTHHLHKDPCRRLADPELYGPTACDDLELDDAAYDAMTMDERLAVVEHVESAAHGVQSLEGAIVSVASGIVTQASAGLHFHSNGFRGARGGTRFSFGASVTVRGEGERRPSDSAWVGARQRGDLPDVAAVGAEATRRAERRVGAHKIPSGRMDLVVENRAAGKILGSLLASLSGHALQQRRSCLEDRLGDAIGSPLLDLVDNPLIARGFASRTFDGDGLASRRRVLFEAGVLRSYLIDVYYGCKLGRSPTGGSTSNLILAPGEGDLAALITPVSRGVLVTGFLGGNSNAATGDFSFGISGQAIVNGEEAGPVGEMNITGNHLQLWKRLVAVGGDPYPYSAWRLPSLRFADVQFSGA